MVEDATSEVPDVEWTPEEIEARRDQPMPDLPVPAGIADVDQALPEFALTAPAAGTAEAMLVAARRLLGTSEHPPGSNHAPPVTTWYGAGNVSWCDEAVSYEADQSGNASAIGGKFAYCPAHTRWFLAHGEWKYGASDLRPGDVVFYNWSGGPTLNADHVGVVEHVLSDGTFYALEGNTSDVFARRHRDHTYVAGRGRPAYGTASPTPTPPPNQEPDMPEYLSVTRYQPEGGSGTFTIHFDRTNEDTKSLRDPNKPTPGILLGGKSGAFFTATVDVEGTGRARLVEVDPDKSWAVTKAYSWHPAGESFAESGCVSPNKHLWLQAEAPTTVTATAKAVYWPR